MPILIPLLISAFRRADELGDAMDARCYSGSKNRTKYKKLKFGGRLAIINRADRTAELIFKLKSHKLEPKRIRFVSGTPTAKPYLVMVEAVKGGKEGVEVLPAAVN